MNEHVNYELQMLEACYVTLKRLSQGMMIPAMIPGGEKANGQFFFNMVHEDFCVHARNLLLWYYAGGLVMPQEIAFIKEKINDQIVTLIPDFRTSKIEEKIGDEDRATLYEHIKNLMDEAQRNSQADQV